MFWFMDMKGMCFLPVFLVIWSSSTFIVSYIIALFEHDLGFILPYISEIGAEPPESCIFGLMTVITACAGMATMYARYKFVEKLNETAGGVPPALNQAAFWIGMLSCLGMCFVATFQSIISYKAFPYGCSLALCRVRTGMATMAFLAVPPTIICALLHRTEDKDNVFHLVSAVSEWIVVFSFIFFFFTYIHDFKKFTLKLRTEFVS
ncbi:DNA damage-regulated autophagy modulator protein 1 isoform X2 [Oncorhynchus mykiss]|uniref:DNA damage-regulated autophagy modulator protein 1 isoform X2 n=1 Tax=Oncorhynchus mykiss TaxID=8022 RepID=UPI000B4F9863|nr:DNA damage-regulated autophagy modulator protein 1 isoform X2 [Oncorhynchus mykiss]